MGQSAWDGFSLATAAAGMWPALPAPAPRGCRWWCANTVSQDLDREVEHCPRQLDRLGKGPRLSPAPVPEGQVKEEDPGKQGMGREDMGALLRQEFKGELQKLAQC